MRPSSRKRSYMNCTTSWSSACTTMIPPRGATFSIAYCRRPKSSRFDGRFGCGGRTSVVKTLNDGNPCWIASGIASKVLSGSGPASVMWKV